MNNHLDFNNKIKVKNYLEKNYTKKRPKKNNEFYYNLATLYNYYPKTIFNILNELPRLGYWKDYFYLLEFSKNPKLDNLIYKKLYDTLITDIENLQNKQPISTLGKWMPTEKSHFDKMFNFVDKFNAILFPHIKKFTARAKYRKLLSKLKKEIEPSEIIFCNKNFEKINFEKISLICFKNNYKFLKEKCPEQTEKFLYKFYDKQNLFLFLNTILFKKFDDLEKKIIEKIWKKNIKKYTLDCYFLNIDKSIILADITNSIYNKKDNLSIIIGIILLNSETSIFDNNIVINSKDPGFLKIEKEANLFNKIEKILDNLNSHKDINTEKIMNLLGETDNFELIILTDKIFRIENFSKINNKIIYWEIKNIEFIQKNISKNIILIQGLLYSNKCLGIIKKILENSDELSENNLMKYGLIFISVFIFFLTYFIQNN